MCKILTVLFFCSCCLHANCQTADFTYQSSNGLYCTPAQVQFTQHCTGNPTGFIWDLGNGTSSSAPNPSAIYVIAGNYIVRLTAIYPQTSSTVTKTIFINSSGSVSIVADRKYICQPGVIGFTANAGGGISDYEWNFGDGSAVVHTASAATTHNFNGYGNFTVSVKATNTSGCAATATDSIAVRHPIITGNVAPLNGCIPVTANFTANADLLLNGSVSSYTWNFGEGAPATTAFNNTSHTYNATGSYLPTVNIITNEGCTGSFNFPAVAYGIPPVNLIAYPKQAIVCGSESPEFVSKADNANSYRWDFGDGTIVTVADTVTQHKYSSLGTKTVTVTPLFNGCAGAAASFQITIIGVIASYNYSNTCSDKKTYSFINTTQGNMTSIVWDFGDGSPQSNAVNVVHTFPSTGEFRTTLRVSDSITGCIDYYSKTIYTADPVLVNNDSSVCRKSVISFIIQNNYTDPQATYEWHVMGKQIGPNNLSSMNIAADSFGIYNNYVVIDIGPESCKDTLRLNHPITVRGPVLDYSFPVISCISSGLSIVNNSHSYFASDQVHQWYWNYGDGQPGDTSFQPATYFYQLSGAYHVFLAATDMNGCADTLIKVATVLDGPLLYVLPHGDSLCAGQRDTLFAYHTGSLQWAPSNAVSCVSCDTIVVSPGSSTQYIATATDTYNCTTKDSIFIKVVSNFTATADSTDLSICAGENVQLHTGPANTIVRWSPAGGLSDTTIHDPVAAPSHTTNYVAVLSDSIGCFSNTVNINVLVKSLPSVELGPDMVLPYNTSYTMMPVYSSNVVTYSWSPFELLSCNNCPQPTGIATHGETYTCTVTSDSGCIARDVINVLVQCKDANLIIPSAFTPDHNGTNDRFYPIARGVRIIKRFAVYNRFGQLMYEIRDLSPNDHSQGWKGQYNGHDQPQSTYVYVVEAVCEMGETITKKGTVVLLR